MQKAAKNDAANTNQNDLSFMPAKMWFTLKEACILKNLNYKTACNKPYLQPNFGTPEGTLGGRKVFSRAMVAAWLPLTDAQILEKQKEA